MNLEEFFSANNKVAIGFSGGVDSSFLLYAGKKYGADIKPYFIKTAFQPEFELEDAKKIAIQLNIELTIINIDILQYKDVVANSKKRCYYCKNVLFDTLKKQAISDGYTKIIDGTNYSDDSSDRPGMRALEEMKILSPLRICKLTKSQIRELSKKAKLFTWNKPAYACLATRIPTDTEITAEALQKVESAEKLIESLGFKDFRVRLIGNMGKLQLKAEQMPKAIELRNEILKGTSDYLEDIVLDFRER